MVVVFNGHRPCWSCPSLCWKLGSGFFVHCSLPVNLLFCSLIKALHLCCKGPVFKWVMGFRNCFSFVHNFGDLSRLKPPSYCSIMWNPYIIHFYKSRGPTRSCSKHMWPDLWDKLYNFGSWQLWHKIFNLTATFPVAHVAGVERGRGLGEREKEGGFGRGWFFFPFALFSIFHFPSPPLFAPTTQATTHPKSITFNVKSGSRPSSPSKVSPSSATNQADGKKKKSSSKVDEDRRTRER